MSEASKKIIRACVVTEIRAFEVAVARSGPKRDYFGNKQFDVREEHLRQLRAALNELDLWPIAA